MGVGENCGETRLKVLLRNQCSISFPRQQETGKAILGRNPGSLSGPKQAPQMTVLLTVFSPSAWAHPDSDQLSRIATQGTKT